MQIVEIKLEDLIPYENNPRDNDDAVEPVMNSIKEFGFKVPMVIDENNTIVCGHTRYKAAQKLGLENVPCVIADDLTEKQIKAFRLADNKVSDYSIWDNKRLLEELEGLNDIFTGFTMSEYFDEFKELNQKDNSVLKEDENGVRYKLTFETSNKALLDEIINLIEVDSALEGEAQ